MDSSRPTDLVLVRHGHSESNMAQSRSDKGDESDWQNGFKARHNSRCRLTDLGRMQAKVAGAFVKTEFGTFDSHYCSEYVRARETAGLLGLNGDWKSELFLRERDLGILASRSHADREEDPECVSELARGKLDEFYWCPVRGESIANACIRVSRVLTELNDTCGGQKVIIVAHGKLIRCFSVLIEKLDVRVSEGKAYNGEVIHYTRRNPETGEIAADLNWVRHFVPWDLTLKSTEWQPIHRNLHSQEQLIKAYKESEQLVNNTKEEWPEHLVKTRTKRKERKVEAKKATHVQQHIPLTGSIDE